MESTSKELQVHCSEAAAKLVRKQDPNLVLIRRGAIDVKGKGPMITYWLKVGSAGVQDESLQPEGELVAGPADPVSDQEISISVQPAESVGLHR